MEALGFTAEGHGASLGLHAAAGQVCAKMGPRMSRTAASDGPWLCTALCSCLASACPHAHSWLGQTPRRTNLPLEPGSKARARA